MWSKLKRVPSILSTTVPRLHRSPVISIEDLLETRQVNPRITLCSIVGSHAPALGILHCAPEHDRWTDSAYQRRCSFLSQRLTSRAPMAWTYVQLCHSMLILRPSASLCLSVHRCQCIGQNDRKFEGSLEVAHLPPKAMVRPCPFTVFTHHLNSDSPSPIPHGSALDASRVFSLTPQLLDICVCRHTGKGSTASSVGSS